MCDSSTEDRYLWQAIVKRFAFAGIIYSILWCVVSLSGVAPELPRDVNAFFWFIFLSSPMFRFLLLQNFDLCFEKLSNLGWHIVFTLLATVPAIAWVFISGLSILQNDSLEINFALIFALVGLVSGGINTFSPIMYQALLFISIMLLPPAFIIMYYETEFPPVIAIYFLLYWAGMLMVGKLQNQELKDSVSISVALERASYVDPLTGLANRRHLYALVDKIDENSQIFPQVVAVAIDIDRFKSINDRYGHTVGDECLVKFAEIFKSTYNENETHCIRMGGEEFLALCVNTNLVDIREKTEELLNKVRESQIHVGGESFGFTVSGGIAEGEIRRKQDLELLMDKADALLYSAKENGRDRVEHMR